MPIVEFELRRYRVPCVLFRECHSWSAVDDTSIVFFSFSPVISDFPPFLFVCFFLWNQCVTWRVHDLKVISHCLKQYCFYSMCQIVLSPPRPLLSSQLYSPCLAGDVCNTGFAQVISTLMLICFLFLTFLFSLICYGSWFLFKFLEVLTCSFD